MCVCKCFAWLLDLIQRTITFCLACCTACVICFGLIVTAIAGVAYGYNYSFAEFITQRETDINVHRRDQFDDSDYRKMANDNDMLSSNNNSGYEERNNKYRYSVPSIEHWSKDPDTKEYARKLNKFLGNQKSQVDDIDVDEARRKEQKIPKLTSTLTPTRRMLKTPTLIPTTVWQSGSSEIVMRKFLPLNDITEGIHTRKPNYYYNEETKVITPETVEYSERQMKPIQPDYKIGVEDIPERELMPINHRNSVDRPDIEDEDYPTYKPV